MTASITINSDVIKHLLQESSARTHTQMHTQKEREGQQSRRQEEVCTIERMNRDVTKFNSANTQLNRNLTHSHTHWIQQTNDNPNRKSAYVKNSRGNTQREEDVLSLEMRKLEAGGFF